LERRTLHRNKNRSDKNHKESVDLEGREISVTRFGAKGKEKGPVEKERMPVVSTLRIFLEISGGNTQGKETY